MQRIGTCFAFALLAMLLMAGPASGVTVLVNIYEKEGNITPLPGAALYTNNALVGKSDSGGNIEFSHPGTEIIQIRVEKLGYAPWSGDIGLNATTLLVEMTKKKVPLTVQVFDTDALAPVAGASVSISDGAGKNTTVTDANGTTMFTVSGDSAYNLEITAPNYRTFTDHLEIARDQKTVQVMLVRDDRFSVLVKDETSGAPLPGAAVIIDGVERGITDAKGVVTLSLPREKVYQVHVRIEGYDDYHERMNVGRDQALVTTLLRKSPYSVFISVYNEERDPVEEASVFLDGQPVGSTNRYGRLQLANLSFGEYALEVRHPGFETHRQQMQVRVQGEDITVDLAFPAANLSIAALEGGDVPVHGATIFINGKEQGTTGENGTLPVRLRLNTPYVISAEKEGFNPVKLEKTVSSRNETAPVIISMERSIDWVLVIVVLAVVVAGFMGAFLIMKKRGQARGRSRRGGL